MEFLVQMDILSNGVSAKEEDFVNEQMFYVLQETLKETKKIICDDCNLSPEELSIEFMDNYWNEDSISSNIYYIRKYYSFTEHFVFWASGLVDAKYNQYGIHNIKPSSLIVLNDRLLKILDETKDFLNKSAIMQGLSSAKNSNEKWVIRSRAKVDDSTDTITIHFYIDVERS